MNIKEIGKQIIHFIHKFIKIFKDKEIVAIQKVIDNDKILCGKNALITGGSGEIGMAIAKRFLDSGCNVVIAGTNKDKLQKCKDDLLKYAKESMCVGGVI